MVVFIFFLVHLEHNTTFVETSVRARLCVWMRALIHTYIPSGIHSSTTYSKSHLERERASERTNERCCVVWLSECTLNFSAVSQFY